MKAIKERAIEQQYVSKNQAAELEIEDIKNKATKQVAEKRNLLKEKISEMRKKSEKQRRKINQKLMAMRNEVAAKMQSAYKVGSSENCKRGLTDSNYSKNYCIANFSDDPASFESCNDQDDFCPTCCDFEFGSNHEELRSKCKADVCIQQKAADQANADQGRWVYQTPVQ